MENIVDPCMSIFAKRVDVPQTEKSINGMEEELKKVDTPPLTLDHYMNMIVETLSNARDHLWKTTDTIKLDRMGIKIEKETADAPVTLELKEYHSSEDRSIIALPIRIPFDQIPESSDFIS